MSEFLLEWIGAIWGILVESGPYLLVGFLLAGLIKVLIPEEKVYRYLGKDDFRSVFIASCIGAPIPLCSCSVIPTALALKKSGASKGATTSFLIATPETGVDSIGLTWALMDPVMTIARPLAALLTAIGCGSLVNLLVRRGLDDAGDSGQEEQPAACCQGEQTTAEGESDPDRICCADQARKSERSGVRGVLQRAVRYGYGSLMADLTPWFILGFLVSGLIMVMVPDDILGTMLPEGFNWLTMLLMLVVGIPLYICATASTPVAAALVAKGLDPGAALVLLLAGPATNVSTLLFVRGFLGKRVLCAYLIGIAVACLAFGFLVNQVYSLLELDPLTTVSPMDEMSAGLVPLVSGAALLLLLVVHAVRLKLAPASGARLRRWCAHLGFDPFSRLSKVCLALLALLAFATTAYTVILPGEVGFLVRFGAVRQVAETPELLLHAPYPLDRVDK
ncbi:MAG: SO_0444 family Cu/Zn efflux transporter, partial [Planctomycetota bacterium]